MRGGHHVVLLHGQPGGKVHWRRVVNALPDDVTAIVMDRPGYGLNPDPPTGLIGNAEAVIRHLDEVDVEEAAVAGHSWGGGIALALAERHPERVTGLVLAAGLGPGAVTPLDVLMAAPLVGDAVAWSMFGVGGPIVRRWLRQLVGNDAEMEEAVRANRARGLWRTFVVEQRAMVAELPGILQGLPDIDVPTTVLAGSGDRIVAPAVAERLAELIPGAQLRMLPGQGHSLPLMVPEAVAEAIAGVVAAGYRPR
ncbi:MAG: hypothetical protein QOG64_493 [Acidimicrobiaceae bacterium]|nr:hypothetical protein [Acidimicrobiaceae bacterium]